MHMPPEPPPHPIVSPGNGDLAEALWRILDPRRWPLDPAQLPPGTALVGGAVRDALLGRLAAQPDLDFVVEVEALELARDLAGRWGGWYVTGRHGDQTHLGNVTYARRPLLGLRLRQHVARGHRIRQRLSVGQVWRSLRSSAGLPKPDAVRV